MALWATTRRREIEDYRRNTSTTVSSAWQTPVSVLVLVDLSHQTSHGWQRKKFEVNFYFKTTVFLSKSGLYFEGQEETRASPGLHHMLAIRWKRKYVSDFAVWTKLFMFVSSTKYLSHSFASRVSFIHLFAFIKLFIYEFLLKTTENPEDKHKGSLVTADYTAFHGSTTKMRNHLNAVFCITTPILGQKPGIFYNFKCHYRKQEHILISVVFPHLAYTFIDNPCTCLWSCMMPWR